MESVRAHFTVKENNDKFLTWSNPSCMPLERGMACSFEVFATQLCTTEINDTMPMVILENKWDTIVPKGVKVEIQLTMKFHCEADACENTLLTDALGLFSSESSKGTTSRSLG